MNRSLLRFVLPAMLAACAAGAVRAQSNVDELSSGAAAAVVLAWRCAPDDYPGVYRQALTEMLERLRLYDAAERALALESAERKMKAFSISSAEQPCEGLDRLRAFARTWGFAHFAR